ncbi:MAG: GntR family transcriptional regulator [Lachnospiraceae bacterium]|nr:GntR family transcriptional regulator [Lachnospiraceae bacterium]
MDIVINNFSETPIYQQMYEQISAQIMKGELKSDDSLPPIRTVAKEMRVSVITVKKAWEELERNGFIYTMVGRGCFIAPLQEKELDLKKDELVKERLKKDMEYYKSLGIRYEELIEVIKDCYQL